MGGQRPPTSFPISLPPTSREDLRFDGYLGVPPVSRSQALCAYKHPCLLRDLELPVPTSAPNHYTGWANESRLKLYV
ncbi:hypothetical protein TNCV_1385011 [Trichonephila clavipes]|nr:hypothetical protein TNCV_1385011 [Trichonephila clavipes]